MEEAKTITIKKRDLWKLSTFILLAILIVLLVMNFTGSFITGKTVSEEEAGQAMLDFALSQGIDAEISSIEKEGDFYVVTLSMEGNEIPVYVTKDGKYFASSLIPLTETIPTTPTTPTETILECATNYGLDESAIIFYYSDSCGWCTRMKPGVDSLEQRGYNVYRANAAEENPMISDCVLSHMTSGGVPQFVCVKTGEIKVGAFADSESNLNQTAMDAWVENCLAN
ncbi:hypothetical protein FJZ20_02505 [Candidatus Pacearchaeota archaeon]|nr:hypothetical protein [Candidatus Pacearchaeota archaeon]